MLMKQGVGKLPSSKIRCLNNKVLVFLNGGMGHKKKATLVGGSPV